MMCHNQMIFGGWRSGPDNKAYRLFRTKPFRSTSAAQDRWVPMGQSSIFERLVRFANAGTDGQIGPRAEITIVGQGGNETDCPLEPNYLLQIDA